MRLIIIDREGRISPTHPTAERLFGYPRQDGSADSTFHEFDASGRRHMEHVLDRGRVAGSGTGFAQEVGQPS